MSFNMLHFRLLIWNWVGSILYAKTTELNITGCLSQLVKAGRFSHVNNWSPSFRVSRDWLISDLLSIIRTSGFQSNRPHVSGSSVTSWRLCRWTPTFIGRAPQGCFEHPWLRDWMYFEDIKYHLLSKQNRAIPCNNKRFCNVSTPSYIISIYINIINHPV